MRIDLERALQDIAASVEDDVVTARLGGRVHHMVTRVRRRRAARYAAQGAVGVGTAAAVAVIGVNLGGTPAPDPAPPATTSPEPGEDRGGVQDDVRRLACGQAAPEPSGVRNGLTLEIDVARTVSAGSPVDVTGAMRNLGSETVRLDGGRFSADLEVVAVLDGRIAGTMAPPGTSGAEIPADGLLRPGDAVTMTEETRLASCDNALVILPEGEYHLVGRTVWEGDGERVELVSEPVPFTVGDHASDGDVEPYGPDDEDGALPLPPGTYEAVAVAAIGVEGTVTVDGQPLPLDGPTTALRPPLEVTIG